jgi:hypothetical protein
MTRLFALAEEVAPLLTGQWRSNRLAEQRSDIRHANEAVLNDDTQRAGSWCYGRAGRCWAGSRSAGACQRA